MFNLTYSSLLGIWWWTVDRMMLTCTLLLMVLVAVLVMAASPPVAERIGLAEHHFVFRQIFFMLPALLVMLVTSILTERTIRILLLFPKCSGRQSIQTTKRRLIWSSA